LATLNTVASLATQQQVIHTVISKQMNNNTVLLIGQTIPRDHPYIAENAGIGLRGAESG
jgi:hypothetical protein